ncbi:MAG: hypothetical protein OHK0039_01790 [Bacteroidia bacterium]
MSYKVSLSTEETYILADKMQEIKNRKLSRRLLAVSLRHFGYSMREISLLVGVSEKTVTTWIKQFLQGGFDQLLGLRYPEHRGSRLEPHKQAITDYWQAHPHARLADLQQWLAEIHGVHVELSWLSRYLDLHSLRPAGDADA